MASFRPDGPLAAILFGGEAVTATAYFAKRMYNINLKSNFTNWKVSVIRSIRKLDEDTGYTVFRLCNPSFDVQVDFEPEANETLSVLDILS